MGAVWGRNVMGAAWDRMGEFTPPPLRPPTPSPEVTQSDPTVPYGGAHWGPYPLILIRIAGSYCCLFGGSVLQMTPQ